MPLFDVRCFILKNYTHTNPILVVFCQKFFCTFVFYRRKTFSAPSVFLVSFLLLIEMFFGDNS